MARARSVLSLFDVDARRIGGCELFARELSRQLAGFGWDSVLCFSAEPPPEVRDYLKLPNVTLATATVGSVRAQHLRSSLNLVGLLKHYRPEILHLHFVPLMAPYFWIARLCGVRRVFHTSHTSPSTPVVPSLAPLWKRALGRVVSWPLDYTIGVSDYSLECILARGLTTQGRAARIYNGVEVMRTPGDATGFRRRYSIPESRSIVLQVSWIIPEKGVPDLIDAAPLVLAQNPSVQFVLAGDGRFLEEYKLRVRHMGLEDHFTWTGLIRDIFPAGAYEAADLFCLASRWGEAFGWVIAEAMAAGKPVVATRVGGIPELVEDGRTGFLVPPSDPPQIASRILTLLGDPELRLRMGQAGRQRVRRLFDLERNVAEHLKLYGVAAVESSRARA